MPTDLLYLRDAQLRAFDATVTAVDGDRVALDEPRPVTALRCLADLTSEPPPSQPNSSATP